METLIHIALLALLLLLCVYLCMLIKEKRHKMADEEHKEKMDLLLRQPPTTR